MITNAVLFDAYGTLLDISGPGRRLTEKYGPVADRVGLRVRALQIAYTWHMSLMGKYQGFFTLTRHALDVAMREENWRDTAFVDDFMDGYEKIEAFPEVGEVLRQLRALGLQPVILSNGEKKYLERAFAHAQLLELLADIITVEEVKIFKPSMAVYQHAKEQVLARGFVSSNPWDVTGAATFGFQTYWLNRAGGVFDGLADASQFQTVRSLQDLVFHYQNS